MESTIYLYFNGNCKQAFEFYQRILGGKIDAMMPHTGTPAEAHVPPEWRDKILHARLVLDGGGSIMASDAPPGRYEKPQGFSVSISVKAPAEADRIFGALSENGQVHMPIQETFWAVRFGMLVDRFGVPWMVSCEKPH